VGRGGFPVAKGSLQEQLHVSLTTSWSEVDLELRFSHLKVYGQLLPAAVEQVRLNRSRRTQIHMNLGLALCSSGVRSQPSHFPVK